MTCNIFYVCCILDNILYYLEEIYTGSSLVKRKKTEKEIKQLNNHIAINSHCEDTKASSVMENRNSSKVKISPIKNIFHIKKTLKASNIKEKMEEPNDVYKFID